MGDRTGNRDLVALRAVSVARDVSLVCLFVYSGSGINYTHIDVRGECLFLRVRFYGLCRGEETFSGEREREVYAT